MKKLTPWLVCLLALVPSVRAQWQTITYTLHGGWNAIYLEGDANHTTIDNILKDATSVISVWRWNPNPNPAQFKASSMVPTTSTPEWSVWVRGDTVQTTLTSLKGQTAYLVRCSGQAADTYQVAITQRILPSRSNWVRNGANFLGFPSLAGANAPTFSNYFATFPAAIASNARVYKYVGGDIGPTNPVQIFSPATEKLDRTQAYWFEATVVGDFYASVEIIPAGTDGLVFGRTGSYLTVRVRNRASTAATITITPVDSVPEPAAPASGLPSATIAGNLTGLAPVPMVRRTFNAATSVYTDTAITGAYTETVAPLSEIQLTIGVDRSKMSAAAGTNYASFLRFTDSGNLMNVLIPCSAQVTGMAGLWVGDVQVSGVGTLAPGASGSGAPRPFPLRVIIHVDNTGVVRLLSQVFIGKLAGSADALGLCTRETSLQTDQKAQAVRLSSAHLPLNTVIPASGGAFALGNFVDLQVPLSFNNPTNPFIHTYHPDHNNRDARMVEYSAAGAESYTVTRAMRFAFRDAGSLLTSDPSSAAVGGSRMVGSYSESITGLHRNTLTVSGTFELRRLNEIGELVIE